MWPAAITFDCYGTLVRWPETLRAFFAAVLPPGRDPEAFRRDFAAEHTRARSGPYRPYSRVMRQALAATLERWGLPEHPAAGDRLLDAVAAIPPYPEVPAALVRLAERYRLAIVSNTEDALIARTVAGLGVPFEVITAEQARAYKPDPALFRFAFERLGCQPADLLHVGAGIATDMLPAAALGLRRVWIDRAGEAAPSPRPTATLPDLAGLPALVERLADGR